MTIKTIKFWGFCFNDWYVIWILIFLFSLYPSSIPDRKKKVLENAETNPKMGR